MDELGGERERLLWMIVLVGSIIENDEVKDCISHFIMITMDGHKADNEESEGEDEVRMMASRQAERLREFNENTEKWNKLLREDEQRNVLFLPHEYRNKLWDIDRHRLGRGKFGKVYLFIDSTDRNRKFAVKCINTVKYENQLELFQRLRQEVILMRIARDCEYIIRCAGMRYVDGIVQIFLEYADGGDLFDQIVPDHGMLPRKARNLFRQLLAGLKHLHKLGIMHRDIKPENLMLMANGHLKIVDFGLATMFRYGGKERRLTTKCGTVAYLSPQALAGDYRAEPTDIWASGLVLVSMLSGQLPWSMAKYKERDKETHPYKYWLDQYLWRDISPWEKFDGATLDLLRKILDPVEERRIKIDDIEMHDFFSGPVVVYPDWTEWDEAETEATPFSSGVVSQKVALSPRTTSVFASRTNIPEDSEIHEIAETSPSSES